MKRILTFLLLTFSPFFLLSQNHDHTWLVGYTSNDIDSNWGGTTIDFNFSPPQLFYQYMDMNFYEYNTSASDPQGNLLFYTNGMYIANKEHEPMENGLDLNPGEFYNEMTDHGYILDQGGFTVPIPEIPQQYYLFHADREFTTPELGGHTSQLYYSRINMLANNGLGEVVEKNQVIVNDTLGLGKITGVRHANGRDWWLVVHEFSSSSYYRLLLTPDGVKNLGKGSIGLSIPDEGLGQASFSSDGRLFARINSVSFEEGKFLDIYEFDRCTGYLSNPIQIHSEATYSAGLAFSPNSRYLYVSSHTEMYQYDLYADDIEASKQLIAEYEPVWGGGPFYLAQLAPDGKIYLCTTNGVQYLHVIHQPNKPYPGCNFEQLGLSLPTHNSASMPNFPNYRLGPLDGSSCDTLGLDNLPIAKYRYEQDTLVYLQVEFTDLSYYEPATWSWDFGDNTTSQDASPVHTFMQDGTYDVCLTVSNVNGEHTFCRTLELGTVSTSEEAELVDINVFPNPCREGVNIIISDYLPRDAKVLLYDAVGQRHKVASLKTGWNTLQLDGLRTGLYFYEIWEGEVLLNSGKLVKVE